MIDYRSKTIIVSVQSKSYMHIDGSHTSRSLDNIGGMKNLDPALRGESAQDNSTDVERTVLL